MKTMDQFIMDIGDGEMSLGEKEPQEPRVFVIFKQFLRSTEKVLVYLT